MTNPKIQILYLLKTDQLTDLSNQIPYEVPDWAVNRNMSINDEICTNHHESWSGD